MPEIKTDLFDQKEENQKITDGIQKRGKQRMDNYRKFIKGGKKKSKSVFCFW